MLQHLSQATTGTYISLAEVLLVDLTLAADNALAIALAVQGLERKQRLIASWCGVALATLLRLALALIALNLLDITGATLVGGLMLLWVAWQSWMDLRMPPEESALHSPARTGEAVLQIVIADLALSLDNVVAVAGAAHDHQIVLALGMGLSMVLVLVTAIFAAPLLRRYRWVGQLGIALILLISVQMLVHGVQEVWHALA